MALFVQKLTVFLSYIVFWTTRLAILFQFSKLISPLPRTTYHFSQKSIIKVFYVLKSLTVV